MTKKKTKKIITPTRRLMIRRVLHDLLLVINGLETLEHEVIGQMVRAALYTFKNDVIAREYAEDELPTLDTVFDACGWDDQGFRWTSEHADDPEDIFIVCFTDEKHTKWRIT